MIIINSDAFHRCQKNASFAISRAKLRRKIVSVLTKPRSVVHQKVKQHNGDSITCRDYRMAINSFPSKKVPSSLGAE